MRICFLAAASLVHTVRWANALARRGHDMDVITMHDAKLDTFTPEVRVHRLPVPAPIGYYVNAFHAKKWIQSLQPDVLLVHYASGYGTLARLVHYEPSLLCVLGSDVYLFPYKNKRSARLLQQNLEAASQISSTSHAMKEQTLQFTDPSVPIDVVPFGIDLETFTPNRITNDDTITIGTVKRLESVYGIDILIKATAALLGALQKKGWTDLAENINLMIVGDGSQLTELKQLAERLGMTNRTTFVGAVANEKVPEYLNELDVYGAFSRSESFGVAVLEASACEVPVVVHDTGGLPEVVQHGETGFLVEVENIGTIARKLLELVLDKEKRKRMGENGRAFVKQYYDWQNNVTQMENNAKKLVGRYKLTITEG